MTENVKWQNQPATEKQIDTVAKILDREIRIRADKGAPMLEQIKDRIFDLSKGRASQLIDQSGQIRLHLQTEKGEKFILSNMEAGSVLRTLSEIITTGEKENNLPVLYPNVQLFLRDNAGDHQVATLTTPELTADSDANQQKFTEFANQIMSEFANTLIDGEM